MNYDDHITGLHDSNSPMNVEYIPTPFEILMDELSEDAKKIINEEISKQEMKAHKLQLRLKLIKDELEKLSEVTSQLNNKYVHNKINELKNY